VFDGIPDGFEDPCVQLGIGFGFGRTFVRLQFNEDGRVVVVVVKDELEHVEKLIVTHVCCDPPTRMILAEQVSRLCGMVRLTMKEGEYDAFLRAIASYAKTRNTSDLDMEVKRIFANEPVLREAYFNLTS
jgi:hypothetical protein